MDTIEKLRLACVENPTPARLHKLADALLKERTDLLAQRDELRAELESLIGGLEEMAAQLSGNEWGETAAVWARVARAVLALACPLTTVRLVDRESRCVLDYPHWSDADTDLGGPDEPCGLPTVLFKRLRGGVLSSDRSEMAFDSPAAAQSALSDATVAEARHRAALPPLSGKGLK